MGQYVHCATCSRAYDARACTRCPSCRPSVEARVAAALEEIASALAEARPDERARVREQLDAAPVLSLTSLREARASADAERRPSPSHRRAGAAAEEILGWGLSLIARFRTRFQFAR